MEHTAAIVCSLALGICSATAFAQSPQSGSGRPGAAHAARAHEALAEAQSQTPKPAMLDIQRGVDAVETRDYGVSGGAERAEKREREAGVDHARRRLERGTAVSGEVLGSVAERLPDQAKPAIGTSREASRIGAYMAREALRGARHAPAAPPVSSMPLGRPSFGGPAQFGAPGPLGSPTFGAGPRGSVPAPVLPGGRR